MHKTLYALIFLAAVATAAAQCPSVDELARAMNECNEQGVGYEKTLQEINGSKCAAITCTDFSCSEQERKNDLAREQCSNPAYMTTPGYEAKLQSSSDSNGCEVVTCQFIVPSGIKPTRPDCLTEAQLQEKSQRCIDAGKTPTKVDTRYDDMVCVTVECGAPLADTVACTKEVVDGCAKIKCDDGFTYNSCDNVCDDETTECTTTIDDSGCETVTCGDQVEVACPGTEAIPEAAIKGETQNAEQVPEQRGFFKRLFGFLN